MNMKGIRVKHLLETLIEIEKKEPNAIIVLSKDAEGNAFRPLDCVMAGMYHPKEQDTAIRAEDLTEELRKQGYSGEDVGRPEDGYVPCYVFYPED